VPADFFGSLVHLPSAGKMLLFGHSGPSGIVWAYDIQAHTWTDESPTGQPREPNTSNDPERLVTYISSGARAGKVLYHQTSHGYTTMQAADWIYDPVARAWTQLTTYGVGPLKLTFLVFDPTLGVHGTIIAFSRDGGLWHGTIQAP
jgi:hypothetical protein